MMHRVVNRRSDGPPVRMWVRADARSMKQAFCFGRGKFVQ
jgi:hypothetical protein